MKKTSALSQSAQLPDVHPTKKSQSRSSKLSKSAHNKFATLRSFINDNEDDKEEKAPEVKRKRTMDDTDIKDESPQLGKRMLRRTSSYNFDTTKLEEMLEEEFFPEIDDNKQ